MLKFLIGPALVAGGYAAGSYYGADAEQIVHTSPRMTYDAIDQTLENVGTSGTTFFEGGTPVPYEIKVERTPGQRLVATLFFAGKQGARADIALVPKNDGRDTLVQTQIHADRSVLRTVLAGTDRARLAYAPDWMLNLTFKPLLKQLATQIESGETARLGGISKGAAEAQREANLSDDERAQLAEWRQLEATQPAIDPDAVARNHAEENAA